MIDMTVDHNKNIRLGEQHGKAGSDEYKASIKLSNGTFTVLRNGRVPNTCVLELGLAKDAQSIINTEGRGKIPREALKDTGPSRTHKSDVLKRCSLRPSN